MPSNLRCLLLERIDLPRPPAIAVLAMVECELRGLSAKRKKNTGKATEARLVLVKCLQDYHNGARAV